MKEFHSHSWLYKGSLYSIDDYRYIAVNALDMPVGRNEATEDWTPMLTVEQKRYTEDLVSNKRVAMITNIGPDHCKMTFVSGK